MTRKSDLTLVPRNGHQLVVAIVARISGCASQKEMSLEDQVDHAKEEIADLYQGPVDYRVTATKGKGEALDRPELAEIERTIRSRDLDVLVMEDVGRLVRGTDAKRLWGIAVDHGVRCIAPNDCLDTADETWEEDMIAACRDHVGHNAHTSKRLKKKLMNRFRKRGGSVALPIAGYHKPDDAQTYYDWQKDDDATPVIAEGLRMLRATRNCSAVADWFNEVKFPTGPYARRDSWNGSMVRRYFRNRLLGGFPGRGFRHTVKRHETGRRISVKKPDGAVYVEVPHLAHVDIVELDEVNAILEEHNSRYRRPREKDVDPLWRRPRKRTRFPGQHARCWYCGRQYVWGGNGITDNLMCSGARQWKCWNSVGFRGELAVKRLVKAITKELYELDGFDAQFAEMVAEAAQKVDGDTHAKRQQLQRDREKLEREKANLTSAIASYGPRPLLLDKMLELEQREMELAAVTLRLDSQQGRQLCLPSSTVELRELLKSQFERLALESPEFGDLLNLVVPDFHVYLVRLHDGGHPLPRAKVRLDLIGSVEDAALLPDLKKLLSRDLTIDLFERPPQRERIRCEAVELRATGLTQRQIAARLSEKPKLPIVQKALALDNSMRSSSLSSPYRHVLEPPDDYAKLRRHKNAKYRFEPMDGYSQSPL